VIEAKIENDALHVSYDPLAMSEKKIEQAIRSTGSTVKAAATNTETAHPDLPPAANVEQRALSRNSLLIFSRALIPRLLKCGYKKSNKSPILKLSLSRLDELVACVSKRKQ
jgi:hypothetical protein